MPNIKNGVNLDNIEALTGAIKNDPKVALVQFKAKSEWKGGTKTSVTVSELFSNGNNIRSEASKFHLMVDEPAVLGGSDEHPNPVEYLASALCGCLTAGIATNAALFGTELEKINVEVSVNFDIHGVLGMDRTKPNGPLDLHYKVTLKGKNGATPEQLLKSKETLDKKSPIKNTIELPLRVTTEVVIEE
ncbi:OsmC family protein [Algoriphagus marinus]|uniref:OsmC family protein n=1 Tax=Algoriphagus marinus TaxID=1925762 RepID=UPI00094BBDD4|nr:OsmC family protein [Algoriphagus marinus]